jgi:hypothetical protein
VLLVPQDGALCITMSGEEEKEGETQQVAAFAGTQVKEFAEKFEKEFLLVFCPFGIVSKGA